MRLLRALAGTLVWILACVVGLLGAVLCVTLILIPLGIPLILLARKLFGYSMTLFLPRAVRHPAQELGESAKGGVAGLTDTLKPSRRQRKSMRKAARRARRKSGKLLGRQRKRIA